MNYRIVRKRRTREHIIADLSENFVEKQALFCGYTAEHLVKDYGYDLSVVTFDANGELEDGDIRVQLKASDAPYVLKRANVICIDISRSDIIAWLGSHMSVILIAYDATADAAYWLYVQRYFANLPDFNIFATQKTQAVHIPKSNVLDQSAMRQFAEFRNNILRQTHGRIDHNA